MSKIYQILFSIALPLDPTEKTVFKSAPEVLMTSTAATLALCDSLFATVKISLSLSANLFPLLLLFHTRGKTVWKPRGAVPTWEPVDNQPHPHKHTRVIKGKLGKVIVITLESGPFFLFRATGWSIGHHDRQYCGLRAGLIYWQTTWRPRGRVPFAWLTIIAKGTVIPAPISAWFDGDTTLDDD